MYLIHVNVNIFYFLNPNNDQTRFAIKLNAAVKKLLFGCFIFPLKLTFTGGVGKLTYAALPLAKLQEPLDQTKLVVLFSVSIL